MEKKTTESYLQVFAFLRQLGFDINSLMIDFEQAVKNAFLIVFPNATVTGCHFHYAQVS